MRFTTGPISIPQFEYISNNQHGERYKKIRYIRTVVVTMIAQIDNPCDMTKIAILSDQLDTPIKYNFGKTPQEASVEVIAKRNITN